MNITIAALCMLALPIAAAAQGSHPSAAASDPVAMGWMQGAPPAPERQVRFDNGSMWAFPQTRWTYSNARQLLPTVAIGRGGAAVSALPRALRADVGAVRFSTADGRSFRFDEIFDLNYTDGIVVLHRGRIVYERYGGALDQHGRHMAFSVTKSFVGMLAEWLIAEGKIDPARPIASYVPELTRSGFAGASVRDVLDMRTGTGFDESYNAPPGQLTDIVRMSIAGNLGPAPPGFTGPDGYFAFVASLPAKGAHGGNFVYRTTDTIALQWLVERVGGAPLARQITERLWVPMGMEQDAELTVDRLGTAFGGGGMSASVRDMARIGEMVRLGGRWNGRQILPAAVVQAIRTPGDARAFAAAAYPGLEGGSYRSQWWHRAGGQIMAVGVHGQAIYIDPRADMVIARFASHPIATNRVLNATTLPAYDAVAAHLSARR